MEWGLTTSQIPFNLFETVWEIFMLLTKIIEFKNGLLEYHGVRPLLEGMATIER
jgi:hypothetical protein